MADGQLSAAQRLQHQLLEQATGALPGCLAWLAQNQLPEPGAEAWKYSPINRLYETLLESATKAPTSAVDMTIESAALDGQTVDQKAAVEIQRFKREPASGTHLELPVELAETFARTIDVQRFPVAQALGCDLDEVIVIRITGAPSEMIRIDRPSNGNQWLHVQLLDNAHAVLTERAVNATGGGITSIELAKGAKLTHTCNFQSATDVSWRLNSVSLGPSSTYELHQASLGGRLQRIDNHIRLQAAGAQARLVGCALCDSDNRSDLQNVVEHVAPNCASQQRYHGVANHSGNLTFGGRIHIHEGATGTNAHLTNANLVLDDRAQINTKPELEIYNDDVTCSHGATIGRLDEEALFYLTSRGIDNLRAQSLLLAAFVKDAIGGPDADAMHQKIDEMLGTWTTAT